VKLTQERISELASGKKVNKTAVENFLGSLGGLSYQEAVGNCEMDAASYRWSRETSAAIRIGLVEHYRR
jgi:hypothetical protein